MSRIKIIVFCFSYVYCFLKVGCFSAAAQNGNSQPPATNERLAVDHERATVGPERPPLGTKTLYEPAGGPDVPAPAGYSPFFINYTGRHGARHTTSLKELSALSVFLDAAAGSDDLTVDGDSLRLRINRLLSVEKKYETGSLTQRGREEQYGIGSRMRERFPTLLSGPDDYLDISYTAEPRTRQSEESFLKAFLAPEMKTKLRHIDGSDSVRLRFYDLSPQYRSFARKGPWLESLDHLRQSAGYRVQIDRMAHRFFRTAFAEKMIASGTIADYAKNSDDRKKGAEGKEREDRKNGEEGKEGKGDEGKKTIGGASVFFEGIYGVASITEGLKAEIEASGFTPGELDIFALLLPEETRWLALQGHARDYLVKGPGQDANGIQVRIALPLLMDLLQTSDSSLRHRGSGVHLRFAHAETVAPIATLLELEGAAVADTDLLQYPTVWKVEQIIPFSANIQWILYRADDPPGAADAGSSGNPASPASSRPPLNGTHTKRPVLVKILYNEKAVHLPVPTNQYPYYEYEKVRSYYLQKIKRIDTGHGNDMYRYLQQIK